MSAAASSHVDDASPPSDLTPAHLPVLIKEWMSAQDEITALSAELRAKKKRMGTVRGMITQIMKGGKIGQLKISTGAVLMREKTTKAALSKKYLQGTLTEFFSGDAAMAAKCVEFIETNRPLKKTENLSLEPN
jgi:hypothetical protein